MSSLIRTCNAKKANREKTTRFTATCVTHHCVTTPHCLGATCLRACLSVSTRITFVSTTHCQTRLPSAPTPPQDPALLVYIPQDRSTNCRARSYFHCAPMSPTRPTMSCSCNNKTNVVSDYFSNDINRSSNNRTGCRTLANCYPCSRNCACSRNCRTCIGTIINECSSNSYSQHH